MNRANEGTYIEARLGGGSHLLEVSPEDLTTLLRVRLISFPKPSQTQRLT